MSLTEEFAHLPQDTEDVPPIFEDTENVPPVDATEDAKTPAGFNKGSNPLFDDPWRWTRRRARRATGTTRGETSDQDDEFCAYYRTKV